jgi:hypothetical protein
MATVRDTRAARLRQAARILDTVRATLNETTTICPHCGRNTHEDWGEAQIAKELSAVIRKVTAMAGTRYMEDHPMSKQIPPEGPETPAPTPDPTRRLSPNPRRATPAWTTPAISSTS